MLYSEQVSWIAIGIYSLVFFFKPSLNRKSNPLFIWISTTHQTTTIIPFCECKLFIKPKKAYTVSSLYFEYQFLPLIYLLIGWSFCAQTPEPRMVYSHTYLHYFIFLSKYLIIMTTYLSLSIIVHLLVIDIVLIFWKFRKSPWYYYLT